MSRVYRLHSPFQVLFASRWRLVHHLLSATATLCPLAEAKKDDPTIMQALNLQPTSSPDSSMFSLGLFGRALIALLIASAAALSGPATSLAQDKPPAHAYSTKHIYSDTADPKADIAAALAQARKEHKRVLLDFGGDWCGDCQVLDIYFHQSPNDELLNKNYILVHIWIGHIDRNLEYPEKYGVAIKKGVPALAVLDEKGATIYSQKTGEFEDMRHMDASSVTAFLEKWKRS